MVRCGGLQKAAAEKKLQKKENSANAPPPDFGAPKRNEPPATIIVEDTSPATDADHTVGAERGAPKRKETADPGNSKATKRPRIKMVAKKKSGGADISRVELHGPEEPSLLTLYAGETRIPSSPEKAVEEMKEEIKEFVPQVFISLCWSIINSIVIDETDVTKTGAGLEAGQRHGGTTEQTVRTSGGTGKRKTGGHRHQRAAGPSIARERGGGANRTAREIGSTICRKGGGNVASPSRGAPTERAETGVVCPSANVKD